ncbi:MAG: hypothetical protein AAGB93_16565 [Planctomycetota bacterium]
MNRTAPSAADGRGRLWSRAMHGVGIGFALLPLAANVATLGVHQRAFAAWEADTATGTEQTMDITFPALLVGFPLLAAAQLAVIVVGHLASMRVEPPSESSLAPDATRLAHLISAIGMAACWMVLRGWIAEGRFPRV